jgi:hypothetical protein
MPGPFDDYDFDDDEEERPATATASSQLAEDFDFDEPEEPPAPTADGAEPEEPAWYESLLDKGGAVLEGLSKGGTLSLHAQPDATVQQPGRGILEHRARMKDAAGRNPGSQLLGDIGGDIGASMLAPATKGAQALVGGVTAGMSEYGRSGDPLKSLGAAGAGTAASYLGGALTNKLVGAPARDAALKRTLTRGGQPEAEAAIDQILGGRNTLGTQGQGMLRAQARARELVPDGYPSPDRLKAAAGEAQFGRFGPGSELGTAREAAPQNFRAYDEAIETASADPRSAGWLASSPVMGNLKQAEQGILKRSPQAEGPLREYAADTLISGMSSGSPQGMLQKMLTAGARRPDSMTRAGFSAARAGAMHLADRAAYSPAVGGALRGGTGAAAQAAGFVGGALTPQTKPMYEPGGETTIAMKPKADETAVADALRTVLSSGDTGLSEKDEAQLTQDVASGNLDKAYASHWRLTMKSPAYAKRIENQLRSQNGAE